MSMGRDGRSPRISGRRLEALREYFEELREQYNRPEYINSDPLGVPYQWPVGVEREIAGLIAAWLASGRARSIVDSAQRLLAGLSSDGRFSLRESIEDRSVADLNEALEGFRYRWIDTPTMVAALHALGHETRRSGSPLRAVGVYDDPTKPTLIAAVEGFSSALEEIARKTLVDVGAPERSFRALKWLLANPRRGGPAKRWMMWLRWFVRSDEVDMGGYSNLGAHRLLVPLDTHIFRISRYLGFTPRQTPGFRAAVEITEALKTLAPRDPLRYDFSISRIGILGHCPSAVLKRVCMPCVLFPVCRAERA